jgi:nitrogen fixation protein NifU and related proteins
MSLYDLYLDVILDHNKAPRNFGVLEPCSHSAAGNNPLCGDALVIYLSMADGRVEDLRFDGSGCAISVSSASIMSETVKGRTRAEIDQLFEGFHGMVTGQTASVGEETAEKLEVFAGVSEFPARVKCASLAWHTLQAALAGSGDVTTE